MKSAKSIFFRANLKGYGIVNYDSKDQSYAYNSLVGSGSIKGEKSIDDNVSYAKKQWINKEGDYKIIISRDCLMHELCIDEVPFQSENVLHNISLLLNMIASPAMYIRGYMNATADELKLKRKSSITMLDALQTCEAHSTMETFSKSGTKNSNSFFKKETIGDIEYSTKGIIDLMQLQFLSCDETFDRFGLNQDHYETYKKIFSTRMKLDSELGYFKINGSVIDVPERGLKFSNDNIIELTKLFFRKLMGLRIQRNRSFAEVVEVEYKIIYNPEIDRLSDENGWTKLTHDTLDTFSFNTHDFYLPVDYDEAVKARNDSDLVIKEKAEIKSKKNAK